MQIGLYHSISDKVNGCTKVVKDLRRGLEALGHTILHNRPGEVTGCLQGMNSLFRLELPKNILVGPEIVVLPSEQPKLFTHYKYWVQPSQWVIDYMRPTCPFPKFNVWPIGIDTERFNNGDRKIKKPCFIYYKNVTKQTSLQKLELVKNYLIKLKIDFEVIEYGKYTEKKLIELTKQVSFAVWLCGSESQNIALMEVLSSGIPIYVVDENEFVYSNFKFKGCSSAPYFDERCGIKCTTMSRFPEFLDSIPKYNPRQYILDNHTIIKGAQCYLEILRGIK